MRRIALSLVALAGIAAGACYASTPFGVDAADGRDVPGPDDGGSPDEQPFCGDEKEPRSTGSFIVDGDPTFDPSVVTLSEGEVLAVGAMLQRDRRSGEWSNVCTGTLVTDTAVLTAAHCVIEMTGVVPASRVRFAVGRDAASPEATIDVREVRPNPAYRPWGREQARADQALLLLARPASEAAPGIAPIRVNHDPLPPEFVGSLVQNVGYGSTTPEGGDDNTLRWWTVEVVTELTEFDFTVYGGGVSAVCFGDSGGPALRMRPDGRPTVVGTVSWGDPSCVDYDHFARTDFNWGFLDRYIDDPPDPCGGLTWYGRCDGDTAVWCEDGETFERNCAACGQTCGDAGPSYGYYCL